MNICKLIDYIDNHLKEEINLKDLSRFLGYSQWYLYKLFKQHTSFPIMIYIRRKRLLAVAKEFLMGRRLYDIAMDYEFATQAGFDKAFQSILVVSQTDWSPTYRSKNEIGGY